MFTFINGISIGIVLGVVLWNIGARLGKAAVGTPSASHNIRRLEMPPSCGVCPVANKFCQGTRNQIMCHAALWRHFSRA